MEVYTNPCEISIYALLAYGYEVNGDRLTEPRKNQSIELILNNKYIYRGGCVMVYTIGGNLSVDEMKQNFMGRMKKLLVFWTNSQLLKYYEFVFWKVILVDTNRRTEDPVLDLGEFLQINVIWILITENPVTNQMDHFCEYPIDLFGGWSISVNEIIYDNFFSHPLPPALSR